MQAFHYPICRVHWCHPCLANVRTIMLVNSLWLLLLILLGDMISFQTPRTSGYYSLFAVSFAVFLSLRYRSTPYMSPLGQGPKLMQYDWLWFFVVVSVYFWEKFPWWGLKTTLICGYKDTCLYIVVRDYPGLINHSYRFSCNISSNIDFTGTD